jgi:predicted Zn finger-like uncharacterized protein
MIVQCPNCQTKYNFDESKLKDDVRLRCTRCRNVFSLSDLDRDEAADDSSADDFAAKWRQEEKMARSEPEISHDDMRVNMARRRKIWRWIAALAILSILALGFFFALPIFENRGINIPFISSHEQNALLPQQTEFTEEDVKDISLENIRQYFVNNDRTGQLFVIEGQAVNNFNKPKSMIKLRASLYDREGSVLAEKDFLCGNVASLFQLQVSSEEELDSILQSRLGILATNRHVEPGSHTPFMTVFYNPPEEMQEFGLEVIEAHDPVP